MKKLTSFLFFIIITFAVIYAQEPVKILEGFRFTEGPAINKDGILFFSDVPNWKIYQYNPETEEHSLYLDSTGGANGLYFDANGNLIACAGKIRKLIKIDENKNVTVLATEYDGKKLNSPNDLWIDATGGVYFTDPRYGNKDNMEQDGMHVYYLPDYNAEVIRVADNLTRPNGIVGSRDGNNVYVSDEGERKTYVYKVKKEGGLYGKELFCEGGIDGLSITDNGNICVTNARGVSIYTPGKELLKEFPFDVTVTNVVYHDNTLYVTAQSGEVYRIDIDNAL